MTKNALKRISALFITAALLACPAVLPTFAAVFPAPPITCAHESLRAHESFIALIIERQGRALNDPSIQIWRARRAFCKRIERVINFDS